MAILQGILAFGLLIGFFVGMCYIFNKFMDLIPDKKGGKPSLITPSYDNMLLKQQCSIIRNTCDCIQDDGEFWNYYQQSIAYQSGFLTNNFGSILGVLISKRNQFLPSDFELILQTDILLNNITSLYNIVTYRIIVLKKYKKEIEIMDEKQKILNDIEEAQRKLDEARKKLDEYNTGYERFKPEPKEFFCIVTDDCKTKWIRIGYDLDPDNKNKEDYNYWLNLRDKYYNVYNCFESYKKAQQEADKILVRRQLEDIAKRLNKGKQIDWKNEDQCKWHIVYNAFFGITTYSVCVNKTQGTVYCLDGDFLDVAKREIGEDKLIKYIRGEG